MKVFKKTISYIIYRVVILYSWLIISLFNIHKHYKGLVS